MAEAPLAKTGRDTDLVPRPGKAEGPLADSGRSFVPNLRWCRSPATFLPSTHFVCILFYSVLPVPEPLLFFGSAQISAQPLQLQT